jgi:hypothetical protein
VPILAAVQVKVAAHFGVVPKVADLVRVAKVDRVAKGRAKVRTAIKAKKYIMASPLL